MMKNIFKILILINCYSAWSQVGIGTHKVDESAALEIKSDNQGMLLPMHRFEIFNSNQKPIINPQVGTLVYNTIDGNHSDRVKMKGIYVWDGERWNQLLNSEGTDKLTTIRMMGGTVNDWQEVIIRDTGIGAPNYLRFKKEKTDIISSSMEGVSVKFGADDYGELMTVPPGFYRIEISIDGWNNDTTGKGIDFKLLSFIKDEISIYEGLGLYVKECVLTDSEGNELTKPQTLSIVSKNFQTVSIQGYTFSFYLNVEKEIDLKIRFNHAPGASYNEEFRVNQNGVSVKFRRYFD